MNFPVKPVGIYTTPPIIGGMESSDGQARKNTTGSEGAANELKDKHVKLLTLEVLAASKAAAEHFARSIFGTDAKVTCVCGSSKHTLGRYSIEAVRTLVYEDGTTVYSKKGAI
jgi:hypothetical protein